MNAERHEAFSTDDGLLQEELRDLQSLVVNSDYVRWATKAPAAAEFDALLRSFTEDWRGLADRVAGALIAHGAVPDARVSNLAGASERAWLPRGWLDLDAASSWVARELSVLASWAHVRAEQVEDGEIALVFGEVEEHLRQENEKFSGWQLRQQHLDLIDEAGKESFPASDPPSFWAGH